MVMTAFVRDCESIGTTISIGSVFAAVFPAIPYCLDLIGGPSLATDETVMKAFRPKG